MFYIATIACLTVRIWVSVKLQATILIVTDAKDDGFLVSMESTAVK